MPDPTRFVRQALKESPVPQKDESDEIAEMIEKSICNYPEDEEKDIKEEEE